MSASTAGTKIPQSIPRLLRHKSMQISSASCYEAREMFELRFSLMRKHGQPDYGLLQSDSEREIARILTDLGILYLHEPADFRIPEMKMEGRVYPPDFFIDRVHTDPLGRRRIVAIEFHANFDQESVRKFCCFPKHYGDTFRLVIIAPESKISKPDAADMIAKCPLFTLDVIRVAGDPRTCLRQIFEELALIKNTTTPL